MMMSWLRPALLALALFPPTVDAAEHEPIVAFAAASLTDSLQKVSDAYTKQSGQAVKLSFAASSALARQIEAGARAHVFFSADQEWMDYLDERRFIDAPSRTDLLGNRLVLIAPIDSKTALQLTSDAPVLAALGANGRLATGDPDSVPAGKYAKAAFTSLGVWKDLEPRLARAENVRVALSYVARGEAPLGVVYATDAAVEPRVRIVDAFPASSHAPITYPVAATKTAHAETAPYLAFLRSAEASAVFKRAGFDVLASDRNALQGCTSFKFDLTRELQVFQTMARDIASTATLKGAPKIQLGALHRVKLAPQSTARFAAPVGKATIDEGSYAGLMKIASNSARAIRVTLNEAAWIDLVDGARAIQSSRHTGAQDCKLLRKSVEFNARPNAELVLQISGSTTPEILLAATEVER